MPRAGYGAINVEVVDDVVGLEPPTCAPVEGQESEGEAKDKFAIWRRAD